MEQIQTKYKELEKRYPRVVGRIYALITAIAYTNSSMIIKSANHLNVLHIGYFGGLLYLVCLTAFYPSKSYWAPSSKWHSTFLWRSVFSGLGGAALLVSASLLDLQIYVILVSLNNPLNIIFDSLRGKTQRLITWVSSISSFIGIIICADPGLLGFGPRQHLGKINSKSLPFISRSILERISSECISYNSYDRFEHHRSGPSSIRSHNHRRASMAIFREK